MYELKIGYNPHLLSDIKKIFKLSMNEDEIHNFINQWDRIKPAYYEKLVAFIDRFEFIDHLEFVKEEAVQNKFKFAGHEVDGIDNDIDALRLYLTLSCIEIAAAIQCPATR